ncbi:MAG TPA: hypothetical protein VK324_10555 [Tepidisphaeraceae bacterium]|nr:hypothetical protein [Tepidisphaeraceae bacterium]
MKNSASKQPLQVHDQIVVYLSKEDGCWLAHSLRMDQIGAGERIVDALADLIRGVHAVLANATEDESLAYLREAPEEVQAIARQAQTLPAEIYEVAHKVATGEWPDELCVSVEPKRLGTSFTAAITECAVCA